MLIINNLFNNLRCVIEAMKEMVPSLKQIFPEICIKYDTSKMGPIGSGVHDFLTLRKSGPSKLIKLTGNKSLTAGFQPNFVRGCFK